LSDDDVAVRATGLGARYGSAWVLRDCTFTVPRGAVAMLAGPNGAGKSTVLSIAAGLTVPAAGRMDVLGADVTARMNPGAAFVSQARTLPGGLTVQEILRMARALNGGEWASGDLVPQLLQERGVDLRAKARTLTEGARALVAITLALARRPSVLLLDEPFSALDPLARDEVLRLLMTEVAERGMTIVVASHASGELRDVCDHLVLLGRGTVALTGAIDEILAGHRILVGSGAADPAISRDVVVHRSGTERQTSLLVRGRADPVDGWYEQAPDLEAVVLGYLRAAR
jgi:ABC-2 type transport system ATP-binding protein